MSPRATREELERGEVPFAKALLPCKECGGGWWVQALVGPSKGTYGWVPHEEGCAGEPAGIPARRAGPVSGVPERLEQPVASILSRVLELPAGDQLDVLALVAATWCYARDRRMVPAGGPQ